jgi:hypothetical protein
MVYKIGLKSAFLLGVFSIISSAVLAQQKEYTSQEIKTVYFEKGDSKLAYPIMKLNGSEVLTIHFDMISGHQETLYYKIIHCDRNWNISDIFFNDYADGFEENPLDNSESSFNTLISYSHYTLSLPNDDIKFRISGNYLLKIYRNGEEENPLLCRRFCIHEDAAPISLRFRQPVGQGSSTSQESEIKISVNNLGATDPSRQITLTILQNGRWDTGKQNLTADFFGEGTIEYNTLAGTTLFRGGNEFRDFDIKTIRQKTQFVRDIAFIENKYHVFLIPSESRQNKEYFYNKDLDGKYLVALDGDEEPDLDADYVYVYFTLPAYREIKNGSVYVSGALTNWEYNFDNRMIFNPSKGCYEATLLLKQGWYNYEFDFVPDGKSIPDNIMFEGSHYETENDYVFLVYFHDPRVRYDRLVEASAANTNIAR